MRIASPRPDRARLDDACVDPAQVQASMGPRVHEPVGRAAEARDGTSRSRCAAPRSPRSRPSPSRAASRAARSRRSGRSRRRAGPRRAPSAPGRRRRRDRSRARSSGSAGRFGIGRPVRRPAATARAPVVADEADSRRSSVGLFEHLPLSLRGPSRDQLDGALGRSASAGLSSRPASSSVGVEVADGGLGCRFRARQRFYHAGVSARLAPR